MAQKREIHNFAVRYLHLFTQTEPPLELLLNDFGAEIHELGFRADLGESFMRMYSGDAFYEPTELSRIAESIQDPYLLGTAIFSRWRLVTQWERDNLLADDKRAWFRTALSRLAELTAEADGDANQLSGAIDNILLVSNNMDGVPGSPMATGMEQRVSISARGDVSLAETRYNAVAGGHNVISRPPSIQMDRSATRQIMDAFRTAFPYLPPGESTSAGLSAEPGAWNLIITNQWGRQYRMTGEMGARIVIDGVELSDLIREHTGNNDLLLFDGNPDLIVRLDVTYRRGVRVPPGTEGADETGVQWRYFEVVSLDRAKDTLEHYLDAGPSHRVQTRARLEGAVSDFLDLLEPGRGFAEPAGNPPDAVLPAADIETYEIAVKTKHGSTHVTRGTYDARSLPPEWSEFIDRLLTFLGFFGYGELFDAARYGRALRRESDYVYALISIEGVEDAQWFLSPDPGVKDNDIVIVPHEAGDDERVGRVQQVLYGSAEDAPDDFSALRRIVRPARPDEQPAAQSPLG